MSISPPDGWFLTFLFSVGDTVEIVAENTIWEDTDKYIGCFGKVLGTKPTLREGMAVLVEIGQEDGWKMRMWWSAGSLRRIND